MSSKKSGMRWYIDFREGNAPPATFLIPYRGIGFSSPGVTGISSDAVPPFDAVSVTNEYGETISANIKLFIPTGRPPSLAYSSSYIKKNIECSVSIYDTHLSVINSGIFKDELVISDGGPMVLSIPEKFEVTYQRSWPERRLQYIEVLIFATESELLTTEGRQLSLTTPALMTTPKGSYNVVGLNDPAFASEVGFEPIFNNNAVPLYFKQENNCPQVNMYYNTDTMGCELGEMWCVIQNKVPKSYPGEYPKNNIGFLLLEKKNNIPSGQNIFSYVPDLKKVLLLQGNTLLAQVLNIHTANPTKKTDQTFFNLIMTYSTLRFMFSGLITGGQFSAKWLYRKYYKTFLRKLEKSEFGCFLSIFIDPQFGLVGYEKYFEYGPCL